MTFLLCGLCELCVKLASDRLKRISHAKLAKPSKKNARVIRGDLCVRIQEPPTAGLKNK